MAIFAAIAAFFAGAVHVAPVATSTQTVASTTNVMIAATSSDSVKGLGYAGISGEAQKGSTSGWKTYSDSSFSVNYPSDLNPYTFGNQQLNANGLSELIVGFAQSSTSDSALTVSIIRNGAVDANTFISQLLNLSKSPVANIKAQRNDDVLIDGINATVIELTSLLNNKVSGTHVVFQKGNTRYELIGAGDYATGPILEQFYQSFKFTN